MNIVEETLAMYWNQHRGLPYKEVLEYIQTDGTQYWDTEVFPANNIGVDLTYAYPTISSSALAGVFGIYAPLNPRRDTLFMSTNSGMTDTSLYYFHRGTTLNINTIAEAGKFNHVQINYLNNNKIIVNDSLSADCGSTTIVSTVSLRISARYNYNNSTWAYAPAMIQVCRISQGNTIIHDYIPVLDYNGDACLYDRVTGRMLYHKNTTGTTKPTFKRWDKIELEYLESTGTQYIDTGIVPNNTTQMILKGNFTSTATTTRAGSRSTNVKDMFEIITDANSEYRLDMGTGTESTTQWHPKSKANAVEIELDASKKYASITYVDGTSDSHTYNNATIASSYSIYLFGFNNAGTELCATSMKIKECTISQGEKLVRSFKPTVWHQEDGMAVACMYDEVYNKMYTNAGTGDFTGKVKLPDGYEAVKYLESTGTQYIDSVVNAGLNIEALLVFSASAFTDTVNSGNGFIGARSSVSSNSCCAFFYRYNESLAVYLDFNNSGYAPYRAQRLIYTGYPIALNTKCSLIISRQARRLSYFQNGNVVVANTTMNNDIFDNPSTLYVGQVNQTELDLHALHGRIYYSLIRDTGLVVRNFIPCVRKSDGKPGLYDLCRSICPLTGTPFYINSGTGEFVTPSQQ